MTTADKVTFSRILLSPFFFILFEYPIFSPLATVVLLWVLFWAIEISDFVDGQVARASNQVSSFGKLFDPFADVLARVTYFVCFASVHIMPLWALLIILYREFGILFLRMMLSSRGIAMGARPGGKLKAGLYMLSGMLSLALITIRKIFPGLQFEPALSTAVLASYIAAAVLSLVSFGDYLLQYRKLTSKRG